MEWQPCWKKPLMVHYREPSGPIETISTREGVLTARQGRDYIIRGIAGEIYLISKDIFKETYIVKNSEGVPK